MFILNFIAGILDRALAWLPDGMRVFVWLPALFALLYLVLRFLIRNGVPWLSGALAKTVSFAAAALAAPLLLVGVAIATPFRAIRVRPPSLLYAFDDAIVATALGVRNAATRAVAGVAKIARMHWLIIVVLSGVLFWWWDRGYCRLEPATPQCMTPISQWVDNLKPRAPEESPATPSPSVKKPNPKATPTKKR